MYPDNLNPPLTWAVFDFPLEFELPGFYSKSFAASLTYMVPNRLIGDQQETKNNLFLLFSMVVFTSMMTSCKAEGL